MNKHLVYMIIAMFGIILVLAHVANKNYEAKKALEKQLMAEKEAVYQMQYLNYQKEKEIEQIKQDLANTGLCNIILPKDI